MPRTYDPWREKHKAPRGFGSHCPELPEGEAQRMLDLAVPDLKSQSKAPALYYSNGEDVFVAHAHGLETYHGYPIAGSEAPPPVLRALRDAGHITAAQFGRLMKQSAVPGTE